MRRARQRRTHIRVERQLAASKNINLNVVIAVCNRPVLDLYHTVSQSDCTYRVDNVITLHSTLTLG
jgi:hypothetical protein